MDSSVRAICYARFVSRTGEQPSDVDLEAEASKYFKEQQDLVDQVKSSALPPPVPLEPSCEDVSEDTKEETIAKFDPDFDHKFDTEDA